MAVVLYKTVEQPTELVEHAKIVGDRRYGKLLIDSMSGFADGRLPGNLGDTPEAIYTGEGGKEHQLFFEACVQ